MQALSVVVLYSLILSCHTKWCVRVLLQTQKQGRPEKLRGPGHRVKVGPQGQGGFHSESQLQPNCKSKTKKKSLHADNDK